MKEPSFSIGVEEEYLLVDKSSRKLASSPPPELFQACESALEGRVSPEFLRCQIEVGTPVCMTLAEVRAELSYFRKTITQEASQFNLAPIAASTHPFAEWTDQPHTNKERYNEIARTMQVVAKRMLICGMHVHVGIEDEELRIELFNQLSYFLPHLLALSTSSPFWRGRRTGLKSYRLSVFNELPRTGLPPRFESNYEYRHTVDILTNAGVIEDATKIWWDLRPSDRFPTLEMRVTDVCPRLDDAIAIAALYRCLCRMLFRLRRANQSWRRYSRFLLSENRWQAQRHGTAVRLIDFGRNETVPFIDLIDEMIELVWPDAEHFGCESDLMHIREIATRGTSADKQLALAGEISEDSQLPQETLDRMVDHLIEETQAGLT
ncbi:carboxylate-amine ligase [Roseibium porphyridii]|uniref:Putative glutamate--cysteine ligase 2 n=1 Tax=Roseibium porphyridii TaxID=2866279 RepID=A0ABY8EX96_9HYPH|nr:MULTISPECIES: carboxylate-amine ligase [Stappiaceae]QFT32316.1 Carboxylate-amine ligase YbdK [Labrenzia sp. THAF82]WFE87653.1 carboxylate-amine ligase [Roseibium sp. KMA01]